MRKPIHNLIYLYIIIGSAITLLLMHCGLKALTVTVPQQAKAGERVTFVMHSGAEPRIEGSGKYTTQLVAGMMVPKSWNARKNAVLTFTSPKGNGTMRLIADSEIEPESGLNWHQAAKKMFGIGPNLVDDFEWIIYRSTQSYTFANNEDINFDVKVECHVGNENMLVRLGFYVGSSIENLRPNDTDYKKFTFSNVLEVIDGEGDLIDFVNPQLGTVQPVKSSDNDIITLSFNSGVSSTVLDGQQDIYLHVSAFDEKDERIATVNIQQDKSKLIKSAGKKFLIDLWPRGYFELSKDQQIARLEYFFTDLSGEKVVGYGNTDEPFKYTFRCE